MPDVQTSCSIHIHIHITAVRNLVPEDPKATHYNLPLLLV